MAELGRRQFPAFVHEVSGYEPFPWQQRLLGRVLESGWPPLLDLPTGTGKTSTLLVALYALALAPEQAYRRIALVVDRRIIVDQVDDFARRLETALGDPSRPTCTRVASRLRALCADAPAEPVRVVHLRGGIPRDDTWVGTPDRPTIIASTVDQVGSRLLFRGYGVSECMRPVHAGVLARDTLYLLDEVHLATAFEQTLGWLEGADQAWAERGGTGRPAKVVRMSATPRATDDPQTRFHLEDDDRAHPELSRRLRAPRPATLEVIKTTRAKDPAGRAKNHRRIAEVACARALAARDAGAKAIGVVLNRIDTARRTARVLRAEPGLEVVLLTGRMRPFERGAAQAMVTRIAGAGVERDADAPPAVVVATSCIEAGADLDFDALVTEVASLDALRQRFGRLNRLGHHPEAQAWVLGRKDQLGPTSDDPVYGPALRHTWAYLSEVARDGRVDFGLAAFPEPASERLPELLPPLAEAPVLFPRYLDLWSETRPAPHPDPDVSLWLHGKDRPPERDAHVVFRADVPTASDDRKARALATEALEFLPPVADEAVAAPVGELATRLGDSMAWRWSADGVEPVPASALRPGDTVILPAHGGGLGPLGTWDPHSTEPVDDVAEPATFTVRTIARLRLDPRCLPSKLSSDLPVPSSTDDPEQLEQAQAECEAWLDRLLDRLDDAPTAWHELLRAIARPEGRRRLLLATNASGAPIWRVVVVPRKRAVEATTEDTVSVFTGTAVSLADHLQDVEAWAAAFARTACLDAPVADDVALAALLHDIGKADPRFQALLHGGDPIAATDAEPLAKSRQIGSAAARHRAQRRSRWPSGLRHELISLALLDASPPLRERAHDLDLVRHLVASHHGWCRPWAPALVDPEPTRVHFEGAGLDVEVTTDALDDAFAVECASRFRRLCRRYGWHGLAYLEALLRLGDHRASATPHDRPGGSA